MSQLLQLRTAVADAIKGVLPTFDVGGHLGRFTTADLSVFLTRAPAVRVAALGLSNAHTMTDNDGRDMLAADVKMGVYVVTKDVGAKLSREEAAMAAVERICLRAAGTRWGLAFARPAHAPTAQTIFNADTLAKGVALWAIELTQPVVLAPADDGGAPAGPLSALWLGIAPEIGAAHRDDYHGPITAQTIAIEGGADV
ncbi:hypothetical protein ACFPIF_10010 [Brevundimonas faecalis]|uniref:hypothetical protein n=1 Tax=Brevundimonas faecalis TaxID=947378 RepID=UPI0036220255